MRRSEIKGREGASVPAYSRGQGGKANLSESTLCGN